MRQGDMLQQNSHFHRFSSDDVKDKKAGCVWMWLWVFVMWREDTNRPEVQNLPKNQKFPPREKFFRKFLQAVFWRKSSVLLWIERSIYWRRRTWRKNLLDKAMVHSNVTWLLHLRIRDPELHCHECVGSGLRQHSHRQFRFWSQDRQSAEISGFLFSSFLWPRYRATSDKRMQRNLWKKNCQEVILQQQCVCFSWD